MLLSLCLAARILQSVKAKGCCSLQNTGSQRYVRDGPLAGRQLEFVSY